MLHSIQAFAKEISLLRDLLSSQPTDHFGINVLLHDNTQTKTLLYSQQIFFHQVFAIQILCMLALEDLSIIYLYQATLNNRYYNHQEFFYHRSFVVTLPLDEKKNQL